MTEDNLTLGSFAIDSLPSGPAFDLTYELDANGILEVTAIHRSSKRKQGITVDSRASGTMSEAEIDDLVAKAEKMKILDETEENRVLSMNRLTSLCNKIKFDAQAKPRETVENILKQVDDCINWITNHTNAEEAHFVAKHETLLEQATILFAQLTPYSNSRSFHFRV